MRKKLLSLLSMGLALFSTAFAQQGVPNGYFNTWTNYNPNGWLTANVTFLLGNDTSAFMETSGPNHKEGAASMRLESIKLNSNPFAPTLPDTVGVAFTGAINMFTGQVTTGFPYAARPSDLVFYYKNDVMPGDTTWATVMLTKWNPLAMAHDTIAGASWFTTADQPNWTLQTLPLFYNTAFTNAYPDSAVVLFSASSYFQPQVGSIIWLDAVNFSGWTGVDEMSQPAGVRAFPNPAVNEVNFNVDIDGAATIEVFDLAGRKVDAVQIMKHHAVLPVHGYTSGIYLYSILNEAGQVLERGKISTTH
jgi:hypothetical protein